MKRRLRDGGDPPARNPANPAILSAVRCHPERQRELYSKRALRNAGCSERPDLAENGNSDSFIFFSASFCAVRAPCVPPFRVAESQPATMRSEESFVAAAPRDDKGVNPPDPSNPFTLSSEMPGQRVPLFTNTMPLARPISTVKPGRPPATLGAKWYVSPSARNVRASTTASVSTSPRGRRTVSVPPLAATS